MAPINLPDGSQVSEIVLPDGSTASEVLAPDGSTVFSATTIPDTVVDDNEWGGPVSDRYSGDTGNFAINTNSPVRDGTYSLKMNGGSPTLSIHSDSGDGLNFYPTVGDKIWSWVLLQASDASPFVSFMAQTDGGWADGLGFVIGGRDSQFEWFVDGNRNSVSQNWATDKWYLTTLDTADNNGDLEFRFKVYDGGTTDASVLQNRSGTSANSTHINQDTVLFAEAFDGGAFAVDKIVAEQDGGEPNV